MSDAPYTFDQVAATFTRKAAVYVANRYRNYGVEFDDVQQELFVWLYDRGKKKVERWLANEPQQTTRIYRSLLDQGIRYAEREKAAKVGYSADDVYWYTPGTITGLMPLVLDDTFVQENGHVGELITMVVDIRRVMTPEDRDYFLFADEEWADWADRVQVLINRLGGNRPHVGRRRVMSNAQSIAITRDDAA